MQTILNLEAKLLDDAVKLGGFKTKEQAVEAALVEFVQRRQRLLILELAGKIRFDADWDYKRMRRSRL